MSRHNLQWLRLMANIDRLSWTLSIFFPIFRLFGCPVGSPAAWQNRWGGGRAPSAGNVGWTNSVNCNTRAVCSAWGAGIRHVKRARENETLASFMTRLVVALFERGDDYRYFWRPNENWNDIHLDEPLTCQPTVVMDADMPLTCQALQRWKKNCAIISRLIKCELSSLLLFQHL